MQPRRELHESAGARALVPAAVVAIVAVVALAPGVLVIPAMVVTVMKALARLDDASGHNEHESEQNEDCPSDGLSYGHDSSGALRDRLDQEYRCSPPQAVRPRPARACESAYRV
jgi:hypothetical protein